MKTNRTKQFLWALYCIIGALLVLVSIPLRKSADYATIGLLIRVIGSVMLFIKIGFEIAKKERTKKEDTSKE